MVLNLKQHTRIQFDEDLEVVLGLIKSMGSKVESQLHEAIQLFREEDKALVAEKSKQLIEGDEEINKLEVKITDSCLYLIAKYSPKANDLRLIFALLRASSEFERIGDTVSKICDTASHSEHVINSLIEKIELFAEHTCQMLHRSLKALVNMDLTYASENYLDSGYRTEYKDIFNNLIEEGKNNIPHLQEYFRANVALRQIERIGDRCRNINEFVYYYVKGTTPTSAKFTELAKELCKNQK